MSHLESIVAEYLDWRGFLVKRNTKVGRLSHGGWEMEIDIVAFHPRSKVLLHCEPSIDALPWTKRELRYQKKFEAGRKYIFKDIFPWLEPTVHLRQIAIFINHPKHKDTVAGGEVLSIDEVMAEIRNAVLGIGKMYSNAIPEQFPLLRTLQLSHSGYFGVVAGRKDAELAP